MVAEQMGEAGGGLVVGGRYKFDSAGEWWRGHGSECE